MNETPLSASATVERRAVDLIFSQLDQDFLAIDVESGYCYSLNRSAERIWQLIAQPVSIAAICAQVGEIYQVDEATCLADVTELLAALQGAGLVEVRDGTR